MQEKITKEQKRMHRVLEKKLNEIMEYLFWEFKPKCPPEEEILWNISQHEKLGHDSVYAHFLYSLGIEYLVAKSGGEYTKFYWLQEDFTCIFITNDAM